MLVDKYNQLIADSGLQDYREQILAVAKPCKIGMIADKSTNSFVGGLPMVDEGFVWPQNAKGNYLSFIAQIECSQFEKLELNRGYLLFFYDNIGWGGVKDRGFVKVVFQNGNHQYSATDLPSHSAKSLFGLLKKQVKPYVYQKVYLEFKNDFSFASLERKLFSLENHRLEELYFNHIYFKESLVQIEGYPQSLQSDDLEQICVNANKHTKQEDWMVLFQISDIGDMSWGDAGTLFWFIHKDDLKQHEFSNMWMVFQCW